MDELAPTRHATVRRNERLVLWIAIVASFVSFLDGTVVNVALPAIQRNLGGGLATQQWVVDSYLVTLGALILVAGSLSDVFGRTVVLRAGLIGFGIASAACAAAPGVVVLIVARAVQGVAGALLVPSSLALIMSTFPDRAAQSRAVGTWTGATTTAMLVGPVLGGGLVDAVSWRLVFVINVLPIGVALVLLGVLARTHRPQRPGGSIDWPGAVLGAAGLGGAAFALIEQERMGWSSPLIVTALSAGGACLIGFLVRQHVAAAPMMPLGLFRIRNFAAGNLATAFMYGALSLNGLVLVVYLQQGAGLPATLAGLASLPTTIIMIAFSSRVGRLAGRVGPRVPMTIGPLVMAAGALLLLTVSPDFDYWTQVLPAVVVFGIGLTTTVTPLTATILGAVEARRSGVASAVNNAVSRVSGMVAVAALGTIAGGTLDLDGFRRGVAVMAVLLAIAAGISAVGIRRPADQ